MSTSYANVSFWGANQKEVVRAAQDMFPNSPCVISDKVNQWVTLFHEKFLLDSGALPQWGSQISRRIGRPAIGISIWYSTVFLYWVYDSNGATIDRSQPADPNEPTEIEARGRAGHPERIP